MALDAQGRPIPVFVPSLPPAPGADPESAPSADVDLYNKVESLGGDVVGLRDEGARLQILVRPVAELGSRVVALEEANKEVGRLKERISNLEASVEALAWLSKRIEILEAKSVDPVSPA